MQRPCYPSDKDRIFEIINESARAYEGVIPPDCYHKPYMPMPELEEEMGKMHFFGWEENNGLVGVMGFQPVKDVTLIRHAYILSSYQRQGIGSRLLEYLKQETKTKRLLVGTWAANFWGIAFYQKHGFRLMADKDALLKTYWTVPLRQIETSVVLGTELY